MWIVFVVFLAPTEQPTEQSRTGSSPQTPFTKNCIKKNDAGASVVAKFRNGLVILFELVLKAVIIEKIIFTIITT